MIPNRNINFPTAIKFGAGRIKELLSLSPTPALLPFRW
jgi:hypothetical protein